jgi:hypothetical protein
VFLPQLQIIAAKPLLLGNRYVEVTQHNLGFQIAPSTIQHMLIVSND